MMFKAIDATASHGLSARFGVQGYPTIKMFPPGGGKTDDSATDYNGERSADALIAWSQAKFTEYGGKVEVEIPELVSQDIFDSICGSKSRCAIAVLPGKLSAPVNV